MTDKPRVVLIDLSAIWWQNYHVSAESGSRAPRAASLEAIQRITGDEKGLVAICCDSGRSFRKEISAEYKAQREKQDPAAYGELDRLKERLIADGFLLWQVPGFEADDLIATACKAALDRGHEVRIASADKDLFRLLNVKVDMLRTNTWEVWDSRKVVENLRVEPEQMTDFLALWGDSSDNVPGCAGIGKGRAAELITQYESIERIYAAIDAGQEVPFKKQLIAGREGVMLSRKLVELRYDAPIQFEDLYQERKVTPLTENSESPPENDDLPSDAATTAAGEDGSTFALPSDSATSKDVVATPTALIPVTAEYTKQLEPRSMNHAVWLGRHLFSSRLYNRFPCAEAITAVILRGRELGLGAATALDVFHVIEGRPVPHAYLIIARAKADPDCEYFYCESTDPEKATWVTKNRRNPKEQRLTYTIDSAKASGLVKTGQSGRPNQWMVRPAEMIRKTAGVQLARMEYPAATLGLYAWEELTGDE